MARLIARGSTGVRRTISFQDTDGADVTDVTFEEAWYKREGASPVRFTASADFTEYDLNDGVPAQRGSMYDILVPDAAIAAEAGVTEVVIEVIVSKASVEYVARLAIELPLLAEIDADGNVPATIRDDPKVVIKDIAVQASPAPTVNQFTADDARLSTNSAAYIGKRVEFSTGIGGIVTGYTVGAGNVRTFDVQRLVNGALVDLAAAIDSSWTVDLFRA